MKIGSLLKLAAEKVNENLPAILTTLGVTGLVGTGYLAYKAHSEVVEVVEELETKRENDIPVNRVEEVASLAKAVYKPVLVGATSIVLIITSYQIQNNRINALKGAVAVLGMEAAKFREKYKKTHGEEAYAKFIAPQKSVTREETDKDGKVEKVVDYVPDKLRATYGVWFSESSEYVQDDYEYNRAFIQESIRLLELKSFQEVLSLNQIYRQLGISETKAGAEWGFDRGTFNAEYDRHVFRKELDENGQDVYDIFIHWGTPVPLFTKRRAAK